ncbi:protein of unknown function DUF112 transmembrane (plasmid) [Ketogulonicigenium robustum]|uniref:DUF112 domain-containing protein n=2 Tax=Ketogulonicigenium robustum TaxID=92947 RepID=A0A1W6P300_9RHOB|nr:protein of unknown function DUF112 transmembrane [Ketogulonicigenium robustum]
MDAFGHVFQWHVLLVIVLAAAFGMLVGAIPGLTATMATSLLVPLTFFMDPVPAVATIVTATAMAIFAGDIPGALLRIPGTPSSAAYVDDSYILSRQGRANDALGASLFFSVLGGTIGTIVLVVSAPQLAEIALNFTSFEYFWLVMLGLFCATFVSPGTPTRGLIALFLGLGFAMVGQTNPTGEPRYTFGSIELMAGIQFIPAMIGLFAMSEVMRFYAHPFQNQKPAGVKGPILRQQFGVLRRYPVQALRGSAVGTAIGILPGAGADIAAWISYAVSKRFSRKPKEFGKGSIEGLVEAGSANNASVSASWVPALVFGIPGDSITAIAIGVLYIKGINPGPTIFLTQPDIIYAVFIVFFLALLLMLPLGWITIRAAGLLLAIPPRVLMPIILMCCVTGAYAINNSAAGILIMLCFGVLGFIMAENDIPVAPVILGLVLGPMLEENFVNSMIKANGNFGAFFERPISAALGVFTIAVLLMPIIRLIMRKQRIKSES